jgi:long-chain acyl-CoA synthetase
MDYKACANLVAMFYDVAAERGDKPFLWAKKDGAYQALSWTETAQKVGALAAGLKDLGVEAGDRVMLVAENRPEWLIADVAIMAIGAITVPTYTTNTLDDHLHIIRDSGAKGGIVSTAHLADRFLEGCHRVDDMGFAIAMEPPARAQELHVDVHSWDDVLAKGAGSADAAKDNANRWRRDDTACIIYTSGTGGSPKGVMLHHGAMIHNCEGARDLLLELGLDQEVFLSFLPLSHSYEHTAGQMFPISIGAEIYYAEGVETLVANMAEAQPTLMTAVPRLYEMMHGRIMRGVEQQGGLKAKLFHKAVELGTREYEAPGSLSIGEKMMNGLVETLVRNKVRGRFGGRLKAFVSGGAPLNPEIGIFFTALGLRLLQGYGQTESAPVISANLPSNIKMHTVGPPLTDVEVKIAEDGEILVRGELVMQGYWRNPEATKAAIQDGWLHTGDVGRLDDQGFIEITDRKKDIIVNSGGDNLSPQRIEGLLTLQPEISQAMVYGDKRPHIVAILVPDLDWFKDWSKETGKSGELADLIDDEDLRKAMQGAIERINEGVSNIEKVRRFTVTAEPFSVDNGQMTPTLKVRRHEVVRSYGDALEGLYG